MYFKKLPDYCQEICWSRDPNTTEPAAMEDGYALPAGADSDEQLKLPPGFRFHPTDEELVTHYLYRKAADHGFSAGVIGEVDLNKCEPWDLPWRGAKMGETEEWYFFCVRDRKYPAGLRTNRATGAGYWKATGKDKDVRRGKSLVGRKKTLVFYGGRAPKGEKTGWVMHEYRLDGSYSLYNKAAKNEWVVCRVFQKSAPSAAAAAADEAGGGGKRVVDDLQARTGSSTCYGDGVAEGGSSSSSDPLPPLMDFPVPAQYGSKAAARTTPAARDAAHVTCFSNAAAGYKSHEKPVGCHNSYSPFLISTSTYDRHSSGVSSPMLPLGKLLEEAGLTQLLQGHGHVVEEGIGTAEREVGRRSVSQEIGFTGEVVNHDSSSSLLLSGHIEVSRQLKVPSECPIWQQYAPW